MLSGMSISFLINYFLQIYIKYTNVFVYMIYMLYIYTLNKIEMKTFKTTESHLNEIANYKFQKNYVDLSQSQRGDVFDLFKIERQEGKHITNQ